MQEGLIANMLHLPLVLRISKKGDIVTRDSRMSPYQKKKDNSQRIMWDYSFNTTNIDKQNSHIQTYSMLNTVFYR